MTDISIPHNTPAIDKSEKLNNRLVWVVAVIAILTLLGVIAVLGLRFSDASKQSTTQHGVDAVVSNSERQDCARAYSAIFTDVDREQRIAASDGQVTLGKYLIGDPTITPDVLSAVGARVTAANQAVKDLPKTSTAVDHGFTLNGKTYPPCPVVK